MVLFPLLLNVYAKNQFLQNYDNYYTEITAASKH